MQNTLRGAVRRGGGVALTVVLTVLGMQLAGLVGQADAAPPVPAAPPGSHVARGHGHLAAAGPARRAQAPAVRAAQHGAPVANSAPGDPTGRGGPGGPGTPCAHGPARGRCDGPPAGHGHPSHTPAAPWQRDGSCVAGQHRSPAIGIPSDPGVSYRLDGRPVGAGLYRVRSGGHDVVASSSRFHLSRSTFAFTLRDADCSTPAPAVPPAPRITIAQCVPAGASALSGVGVVAPASAGVLVGRPVVSRSGSLVTVSVSAQARPGYRFVALPTGWQRVGAARALYTRQVAAPTTCHPASSGASTSATASSVHLGTTLSAPAGTTVTARVGVAASRADLSLRTGTPCGANCLGPVTATPASFQDNTCLASTGQPSGASYRIPATKGVLYWVNGANVTSGSYPARDGSTVTVVVSALSGYSLTGITQWTHTFTGTPTCSGIAQSPNSGTSPGSGSSESGSHDPARTPARSTDSSQEPAYTGTPVDRLVLTGLLLLLLGTTACVLARRRQTFLSAAPAGVACAADTTSSCGRVGPNPTPARSDRRFTAGRLGVLFQDPAAGSGRTPPRPGPAAGPGQQLGANVRQSPPSLATAWRAALTRRGR